MDTPWLSDEEVADLCAGLKQAAAQIRFLGRLGLAVHRKPNGRPIVMRAAVEAMEVHAGHVPAGDVPAVGKQASPREPNRGALIELFNRGVPYAHGRPTKKQPAGA